MSDRLRLVRFPPDIVDRVRIVLEKKWIRGIQSERGYSLIHAVFLSSRLTGRVLDMPIPTNLNFTVGT